MAYFSDHALRGMNAALSLICLEARNSAPPGAMWNDVLDRVYPIIQEHIRLQTAALSRADKVPNELLVEVFACLPLWDRVRAATVCHKWRNASLGSSRRLWSDVQTPRTPGACRFLLERAKSVPVTLRIEPHLDNVQLLSEIIAEHLHHIRVLDLTLPRVSFEDDLRWDDGQIGNCLELALQGHAPILENIRIVSPDGWMHINLGALACLNNHLLRTVELRGISLSCLKPCAGASNIRSLLIVMVDSRDSWTQDHFSLLCSFRALETLSLKVSSSVALPAAGRFFPVALKHLSLELNGASFVHLSVPGCFARLDTLRISFNSSGADFGDLATTLPIFQGFVPVSAAIRFNNLLLDMLAVDAAGRKRIVQAVKYDPSWCVAFAKATRLTIDGLAHLPRAAMGVVSSLPALEELTFDVTVSAGLSGSNWFQWPRLACPDLRTVHVRSTQSSPEIALSVLSDVLQNKLGATAGKLETLVIDRVCIVAPPAVNIASALHDLADTVSTIDSGTVWPESHSVWAKPWDRETL